MPTTSMRRGLYLITPDDGDAARLLTRALPLLPFAACLQLRNKTLTAAALRDVAIAFRDACRDLGVTFILNDDARLAREVDADGVHLGEHDDAITDARNLLGENAIIGASCYDDLQRAQQAVAAGANYVAFGAFFPSPTKPAARRASLALIESSADLGVPRVAIGGITPDNARPLVAAGADLIAVISGVFDTPEPVAAARAYLSCFEEHRP